MTDLPALQTLRLTRAGRLLTIAFNRPDVLNAVNTQLHRELIDAFAFAARDAGSDVIVLTGEGRAFSAGGDLEQMERMIAEPALFEAEVRDAKLLVFALLDIEKPVIARVNGHAVGLGATLALLCDVTFVAESAKIGDPHVGVGLVAGDGGAVIWPQLVGFNRAKEFLMTGDLLTARRAAEIGLINHVVPDAELDAEVEAFCNRLLSGATEAIRWTKVTINLELKRLAHALLDPGLAYEALSLRTQAHRARVAALRARRERT
ncbi:enoyl-CoA hydratase/isomerase family protein [Pararhodobacter aggregans]|uniref:Enoyl-CoA hydratase n=1 Tax=Pararhodobacter aggregans TaxID=404875 RepID=A0A2T7UV35_9RHOB|nr:enoyl-CoA hydratase/isomerase family protein [Pararhodobacter aggregans]PTX04097.1 enoyl-CoA hydratase [Pararhodobacter aggregans]PVE48438.1 enoyl-CoA hydratase [Pararhodobacter aggregans]